jgi:hypothetical protein
LQWIARQGVDTITLRLDTDALVIAPFVNRIVEAFELQPDAGILGLYDRGVDGTSHAPAFRGWQRATEKLGAPIRIYRRPPIRHRYLEQALWGPAAKTRHQYERARRNGYRPGENILPAACTLSPAMLTRMAQAGDLDDPLRWRTVPVVDDIMLSIAAYAVGLRISATQNENPFGLMHRGLPDTPSRLVERGFSFVHSVKTETRLSEKEIRAYFAERRPSPPRPAAG